MKNFKKLSLVAGFATLMSFGAEAQNPVWTNNPADAKLLETKQDINISNTLNSQSPPFTVGKLDLMTGKSSSVFSVNNVSKLPTIGTQLGMEARVSLGFNLVSYPQYFGGLWRCNSDGANNGGSGIITDIFGNISFINVASTGSSSYQDIAPTNGQNILDKRTVIISPNGLVQIAGDNGKFANVGIPADVKLAVNGRIYTTGIKVSLPINNGYAWPDYVFKQDYKLRTLAEVEHFIAANNHLPDVPSELEVKTDGIELATMDAVLLRKVEELTLYMIQLQKDNLEMKAKLEALSK